MRALTSLAFIGLTATCVLTGAAAPHKASAQTVPASQTAAPAVETPAPLMDAPTPPPATVLSAAVKSQAIAAAARLLTDTYILPDVGAKAAAMLTQNLAAGKYDKAATPFDFANLLTQDLQDLTHDAHLRVMGFGPGPGPGPGPRNANGRAGHPPAPGADEFVQIDRLKGNIGYIELDGFLPKGGFKHGADSAMALVASTDALIIDLRNNHGGDVDAVAYLNSFFFDGKTPVHVEDMVWRKPGTPTFDSKPIFDRKAYLTEPTPVSYVGKPVYLITGRETFSGGEGFAYEMQAQKRATLIGEVTGGGANPGGFNPIGPGLVMFVPTGRAENPVTHTNWDGKGVQPDMTVSAGKSFATTYAVALHALGRSGGAATDTLDAVIDARLIANPRMTPLPGGETALRQWEAGMAAGHPPYDIFSADGAKEAETQVDFLSGDLGHRGALQSLTFAEPDPSGGDVYEATFADKSSVQFTIFLTQDGKIDTVVGQPY